jgi:hypothetical protein
MRGSKAWLVPCCCRWVDRHQMDRFDHIYGVFITSGGRRRRLDVILVPHQQWWYALVGWTGSKQYLRWVGGELHPCCCDACCCVQYTQALLADLGE